VNSDLRRELLERARAVAAKAVTLVKAVEVAGEEDDYLSDEEELTEDGWQAVTPPVDKGTDDKKVGDPLDDDSSDESDFDELLPPLVQLRTNDGDGLEIHLSPSEEAPAVVGQSRTGSNRNVAKSNNKATYVEQGNPVSYLWFILRTVLNKIAHAKYGNTDFQADVEVPAAPARFVRMVPTAPADAEVAADEAAAQAASDEAALAATATPSAAAAEGGAGAAAGVGGDILAGGLGIADLAVGALPLIGGLIVDLIAHELGKVKNKNVPHVTVALSQMAQAALQSPDIHALVMRRLTGTQKKEVEDYLEGVHPMEKMSTTLLQTIKDELRTRDKVVDMGKLPVIEAKEGEAVGLAGERSSASVLPSLVEMGGVTRTAEVPRGAYTQRTLLAYLGRVVDGVADINPAHAAVYVDGKLLNPSSDIHTVIQPGSSIRITAKGMGGYAGYLSNMHNKLMHAINGNTNVVSGSNLDSEVLAKMAKDKGLKLKIIRSGKDEPDIKTALDNEMKQDEEKGDKTWLYVHHDQLANPVRNPMPTIADTEEKQLQSTGSKTGTATKSAYTAIMTPLLTLMGTDFNGESRTETFFNLIKQRMRWVHDNLQYITTEDRNELCSDPFITHGWATYITGVAGDVVYGNPRTRSHPSSFEIGFEKYSVASYLQKTAARIDSGGDLSMTSLNYDLAGVFNTKDYVRLVEGLRSAGVTIGSIENKWSLFPVALNLALMTNACYACGCDPWTAVDNQATAYAGPQVTDFPNEVGDILPGLGGGAGTSVWGAFVGWTEFLQEGLFDTGFTAPWAAPFEREDWDRNIVVVPVVNRLLTDPLALVPWVLAHMPFPYRRQATTFAGTDAAAAVQNVTLADYTTRNYFNHGYELDAVNDRLFVLMVRMDVPNSGLAPLQVPMFGNIDPVAHSVEDVAANAMVLTNILDGVNWLEERIRSIDRCWDFFVTLYGQGSMFKAATALANLVSFIVRPGQNVWASDGVNPGHVDGILERTAGVWNNLPGGYQAVKTPGDECLRANSDAFADCSTNTFSLLARGLQYTIPLSHWHRVFVAAGVYVPDTPSPKVFKSLNHMAMVLSQEIAATELAASVDTYLGRLGIGRPFLWSTGNQARLFRQMYSRRIQKELQGIGIPVKIDLDETGHLADANLAYPNTHLVQASICRQAWASMAKYNPYPLSMSATLPQRMMLNAREVEVRPGQFLANEDILILNNETLLDGTDHEALWTYISITTACRGGIALADITEVGLAVDDTYDTYGACSTRDLGHALQPWHPNRTNGTYLCNMAGAPYMNPNVIRPRTLWLYGPARQYSSATRNFHSRPLATDSVNNIAFFRGTRTRQTGVMDILNL
jgi:hypothetical protein